MFIQSKKARLTLGPSVSDPSFPSMALPFRHPCPKGCHPCPAMAHLLSSSILSLGFSMHPRPSADRTRFMGQNLQLQLHGLRCFRCFRCPKIHQDSEPWDLEVGHIACLQLTVSQLETTRTPRLQTTRSLGVDHKSQQKGRLVLMRTVVPGTSNQLQATSAWAGHRSTST